MGKSRSCGGGRIFAVAVELHFNQETRQRQNAINVQRTIGGTVSRSEDALAIKSSNPSSKASESVAWMSISTGRPRWSAHRRLSTAPGTSLEKIVESEVGAVADDIKASIAVSGFSISKGMM